jgi:hypothetical protein
VAVTDFFLWLRVRDCLSPIWLKRIVRKEVVSTFSRMDLLLRLENMEMTCISQTLLCEDNFFCPSTRMWCVPEDIVHEIKSSDSRFSHFFLSALPSFRICHISSNFVFPMIKSRRGREPEDFSRLFPHRQMGIWSLLWTLSLSLGRVLNHAAGLISEKHDSGGGVMKLLPEAWNLVLCLWKLKTRLERFLFCFLFWEMFTGRCFNANYTQWT